MLQRSFIFLFLQIALFAMLANCSISTATQMLSFKDQPYGTHKRQVLDVYAPKTAHNAPVIFMVHGGGWRHGSKSAAAVVDHKIERWVNKGFVFISTNYRLLPDADPLQQANDIAAAVAFAQKHAPTWGADADKFVLMGHSAGAHLVSLLTADPGIAHSKGALPWLATVAIDSGGFDITKIMQRDRVLRLYRQAFGDDPKFWRQASPIYRLQQKQMPLLAICSQIRRDKPCEQAQAFADKAHSLGMRVEVLPIKLSHRQINVQLGEDNDYTAKVEKFLGSLDPRLRDLLNH